MSDTNKDANKHVNADVTELGVATDAKMHLPYGATSSVSGNQPFKTPDGTTLGTVQWFPGRMPPVIERKDPQVAAPASASVPPGSRYLLQDVAEMDIDTIVWQSGTTVRITFNGSPTLPAINDYFHVNTATNSSNDGSFLITAVAAYIEITNADRTDGTDDEASDSPATGKWTDDTWGGAPPNAWTEVDQAASLWRFAAAQEGNIVYNKNTKTDWIFDGSDWSLLNKINTGSYAGDGSNSLEITGVGFTPKYVKIWQRETIDGNSVAVFETTTEIMDDDAAGMAVVHAGSSGHSVQNNTIISFGSDGFTVDDNGGDEHPNKSGTDYNYLVLG